MISLRAMGLVVSNAGVGVIDNRIGAKLTEMITEAITNVTYSAGSATSSRPCAETMPVICTIM